MIIIHHLVCQNIYKLIKRILIVGRNAKLRNKQLVMIRFKENYY